MKEKTSVTLSSELLKEIDRLGGRKQSRSAFIEEMLQRQVREHTRAERRARDIAILNRYADEMNRDAEEGLEDQAPEED